MKEDEIYGAPSRIEAKLLSDLTKHTLMFAPDADLMGRFPSSRDWNIPTIKCSNTKCAANYHKECTMPSLIEMDAKGKCKGFHPRKIGKKK